MYFSGGQDKVRRMYNLDLVLHIALLLSLLELHRRMRSHLFFGRVRTPQRIVFCGASVNVVRLFEAFLRCTRRSCRSPSCTSYCFTGG